jgi:hypothetical protein
MKRVLPILAAAVVTLAGCATRDGAGPAPQPKQGLAEHQRILRAASKGIASALSCLERVSAQTNRCPSRLVAALAAEVQDLQVKSIKVRSRWQAMQARGDAYFQNWQESLAHVKDPRVRKLAEEHRPELEQRFGRIKVASQQAREAFKPFLSGLRALQIALEIDAGNIETKANRELIGVTREEGAQVERALATLQQEIDAMAVMLTPGRSL